VNAALTKVVKSGQKKSLRQWLQLPTAETAELVLPKPPARHRELSEAISQVAKPDSGTRTQPAPQGLALPPIL
jgi:hypothetical protein